MSSRHSPDGLVLPRFAERDRTRPLIVAIEGPNGAGKTTLCAALAKALHVGSCLGTDPAWFRPAFKTRMIRDAAWYASAMFFISGCLEQLRLLQGRPDKLIIMDRCLWSTFAVHAAEDSARLKPVIDMVKPIANQIQIPDLVLVLEASFLTCQNRIAKKSRHERALDKLTATSGFHMREQQFYRWLARQVPNLIFVETDRMSAKEVAAQALALLRDRIAC